MRFSWVLLYTEHSLGITAHSLVVQNRWRAFAFKGLGVEDVLKFLHPFRGVMDVSCQVTVEKAEGMTVEGETDAHASFITLSRKTA